MTPDEIIDKVRQHSVELAIVYGKLSAKPADCLPAELAELVRQEAPSIKWRLKQLGADTDRGSLVERLFPGAKLLNVGEKSENADKTLGVETPTPTDHQT